MLFNLWGLGFAYLLLGGTTSSQNPGENTAIRYYETLSRCTDGCGRRMTNMFHLGL